MKHLEAVQLLPALVEGDLDARKAQALKAHVSECEDCGGWLATYNLLSVSLRNVPALEQHLSTEELCDFALGSLPLSDSSRDRCERHAASCRRCSEEVRLVREAVKRGPETAVRPWAHRTRAFVTSPALLAAAAALLIALGGWLAFDNLRRSHTDQYRLVGRLVQGSEAILARRSIVVETTTVEAGSELSLQSPIISFGNGFTVMSGGSLVAGRPVNGL